ncbi:MAG: hypothetical protein KBH07_05905 [Flavobacteriales bacterium]|nr:hypothetical protein [Flavobacteriales bacterium]MBP9080178.1 hypothetical protein [Flavobacteriales bacterium]
MHSTTRTVFLAMIASALCLAACTKEEPEQPAPDPGGSGTTPTNTSTTPTFNGSSGTLWAINTYSSQVVGGFPFEMESGMGVALFPSAADAAVLVDAGTVKLNDLDLTRQSNNTYISLPSQTNPMGIDLSSGTTHWTVSGANGVPAVDQTPSFTFPDVGEITSSTTVDRGSGYTLSANNVSACDSVVFMVGGVVKYKPSGTSSCTFTSAELAGLAAGPSLIQVSAYSYAHQVIGGKDFYFGKQTARTLGATVQ